MNPSDMDEIERLTRAGHSIMCAFRTVCDGDPCGCGFAEAALCVRPEEGGHAGPGPDHYASIIRTRDAATAAEILADLCRKKDKEISQLREEHRL